jgi:transposase-like protein
MGKRTRCTAEEKIRILREVVEDRQTISIVADKYGIHPRRIWV